MSRKVETNRVSLSWRIGEGREACPYSGILFGNKNDELLRPESAWMNLADIMLNERSVAKEYILCSFVYVQCLEKAHLYGQKVDWHFA